MVITARKDKYYYYEDGDGELVYKNSVFYSDGNPLQDSILAYTIFHE
jgi:hypothetical protein